MNDVVLKIHTDDDKTSKDKEEETTEVKLVDLGDKEKTEWVRSREFLKQQIRNYVQILVMDEVAGDLTKAILDTPAGRFEGGIKQGGRAKFVGAVWDSRVMGESSARPSIRMPPLQIAEVNRQLEASVHAMIGHRQHRQRRTSRLPTMLRCFTPSTSTSVCRAGATWAPNTSGSSRQQGRQPQRPAASTSSWTPSASKSASNGCGALHPIAPTTQCG